MFESFTMLDNIFLVCAVVGGTLFTIRLGLQLIGVFDHADMDFSGHDVDLDHGGEIHASDVADIKLLTLQGITAFFMMFGLVGLMLRQGFGVWGFLSFIGASAAGGVTMWAIAKVMVWMLTLQSSGTIEDKSLIGAEGAVYLTIPAGGVGKVHITVQGTLMEYDAESGNDEEIKTGEQVRVVFMKGDNVLVEKI